MNKLIFLDIPLFADLSRVHKAALLQEFTQLSYRKGDLLFEEGEFGDSLYIIMQGQARIYLSSTAGGKTTLAILGEKEYFGEMALLTGDPRSASAMAESDLVVLRLVKESFDRILLEHNALAVQFAGILARRLARVNRQSSQASSSQEESGEAKALTSGGALREDMVAEERPGEHRERLDQRDQREQGEQQEGAGADAASRRSPQVRALGAVISLVAGLLLYAAMQTGGQPTAAAALTGTGLTALLLTACGVVSPLLAAMLMAASAVSLPGIGLGGGISASFV
ncbi:cyclic nucleotide-binding domain-containing protein, partial [Paenibacillus periandrae]|uniref:cyclic nucleotide-binding domain-containing protein n=1 Tax=Paenibacillus periandrae TaxID=1761741 RepID=UPI001F08F550